ncbi:MULTISPECIES: hypothetical protein [Pandoraea]|uniref:hypothetical protein n=1 Tax=Pandoraea TaxID=93217 RepID=UPI0003D2394E|nr:MULTISPECIES: hypothetical protein [Pandoraea]AHB78503.1 hypothetical protein X636_11455 [Pandoraea pnomenusa]
MLPPANDTPGGSRRASTASRARGGAARGTPDRHIDAASAAALKLPRESQAMSYAKRTLALRREPPKASDVERYLRRWFIAPPSVLIALASDEELRARNAIYPPLRTTSARFGDIAYASYVVAQGACGHDGTHLRTCVVSITQGNEVVTFPALQAWTHDGEPIVRADALSHLHYATERIKATTPAQHMRRHSLFHAETRDLVTHDPVLQSGHRAARLGMWLAAAALLERGNASVDAVLRDIRIGAQSFDPTFRQYQELARLARSRHRRNIALPCEMPAGPSHSRAAIEPSAQAIAPSSLSRTLPDARSSPLSQRCQ